MPMGRPGSRCSLPLRIICRLGLPHSMEPMSNVGGCEMAPASSAAAPGLAAAPTCLVSNFQRRQSPSAVSAAQGRTSSLALRGRGTPMCMLLLGPMVLSWLRFTMPLPLLPSALLTLFALTIAPADRATFTLCR